MRSLLQQIGTFVVEPGPTPTHHYHPESLVYITVHSQCSTLYGLGQIYNGMYPPYCIMQSRFTALKILYVLPFHLNLSSVN